MNAFRTRLNVLGLEGRDTPSATPLLPLANEPAALARKHIGNVKYGEVRLVDSNAREVQQITVLGAAPAEPAYLKYKLKDSIVTNLTAGQQPAGRIVYDLAKGKGFSEQAAASGGEAGRFVYRDITWVAAADHDAIYVGTANSGAARGGAGDADIYVRMGSRPTS